jgi:hypothetical protein
MLRCLCCIALCVTGYAIAQEAPKAIFAAPIRTSPVPPESFWYSFFSQTATLDEPEHKLQETLGLTGHEAERIYAIAKDCVTRHDLLEDELHRLTLDSRLEVIRSGDAGDELTARLKANEDRRRAVVPDHIRDLRRAVDPRRFQLIESFVLQARQGDAYFPK